MGAAPAPTVGIDLGGTHLRAAVVDRDGRVLDEERGQTPSTLDEIVAAIAGAAQALRRRRAFAGVGIGAAGMVDHEGVIAYAPNVPAFVDAPLARLVGDALGHPVVVDNDANVAALAELTHGAARGRREVLLVTLGTGVGGGIVSGGRILRGAHGFAAELGHFQVDPSGPRCACGEVGHWEALASGTALGHLGRAWAAAGAAPGVLARVGGDVAAVTGADVGAEALAGDADALAILAAYARQVAIGLVGLANILDPEIIVVSGGLVVLGEVLLAPIRAEFAGRIEGAAHRPPIDVVEAELGEQAGVVGAAVLAREAAG